METLNLRLEALTPVRIGSYVGQITPYDYVISGGNCYVISDDKLSAFLGEKGLIEDFSEAIRRKAQAFNIGDYLASNGVSDEAGLKSLSRYVVQVHGNARPLQMMPLIRDVGNKPYVPGSSIKGAIRTAVIYNYLKGLKSSDQRRFEQDFIRKIERRITDIEQRERRRPARGSKGFAKRIVEEGIAQYFDLERYTRRDGSYLHDPHTDIFRCLKVTDALPSKPHNRIYDFRVLDKQNNGSLSFESPIFAEALSPGAAFEFTLSWDAWLAERFKERNELLVDGLEQILQACRVFVSDQIEWEREFFESCGKGDRDPGKIIDSLSTMEADIRLGWGSGLVGASLSMLLPEPTRKRLRDLFYRRGSSAVRDFPKSRRVMVENEKPVSLLGFCKLIVL